MFICAFVSAAMRRTDKEVITAIREKREKVAANARQNVVDFSCIAKTACQIDNIPRSLIARMCLNWHYIHSYMPIYMYIHLYIYLWKLLAYC